MVLALFPHELPVPFTVSSLLLSFFVINLRHVVYEAFVRVEFVLSTEAMHQATSRLAIKVSAIEIQVSTLNFPRLRTLIRRPS